MTTLTALLVQAAARRPGKQLHWHDHGSRSYDDWLQASRRCAGALQQLGVQRGDRIAFWLPNSWAYLDLVMATVQLGAIAVAVNTRFRSAEVGKILGHSRPKVLVVAPSFHGIDFPGILAGVPKECLESVETVLVCDDSPDDPLGMSGVRHARYAWALSQPPAVNEPHADDGCAMFTTSGTTGGPKFVLHTHRSVARHAVDAARAYGYDDPAARLLHPLPFCGIFGFSQLTATLAAAAYSAFVTVFDAPVAARLMIEHNVTYTSGTDDLLKRLLEAGSGDIPFPLLRECVYAGFNPALALFPEVAEKRGMRLLGCFGMSEIHSFFSRQRGDVPVDIRKRPGGYPITSGVIVRARDPETGCVQPSGEVGELEIKSPNLFSYYFDQPEATAKAFTDDGFFRTGDLGCVFDDGRYEFRGRAGDFMRLGGFLVDPLDIELEIQAVQGVETAIAVAVPSAAGTRVVAFVKLLPGVVWDESRLREHCVSRLANFKVPARFVPVDRLPVANGPNGEKVQRSELKKQALVLMGSHDLP